MSKALKGEHYCLEHRGNHSHYDPKNCTVCKLEEALQEAIDTISFLSNHLQGRMGEGALTEMALKADEWSEALAGDGENDVMRSIDPSWADDDTPPGNDARGEALEALNNLVKFAWESPRFCVDNPSSARNPERLANVICYHLTAPPTVPEAIRGLLEEISDLECVTRQGGADPMDLEELDEALHDAIYKARRALDLIAQHSEPENDDAD